MLGPIITFFYDMFNHDANKRLAFRCRNGFCGCPMFKTRKLCPFTYRNCTTIKAVDWFMHHINTIAKDALFSPVHTPTNNLQRKPDSTLDADTIAIATAAVIASPVFTSSDDSSSCCDSCDSGGSCVD